jgi:hypothetical protein
MGWMSSREALGLTPLACGVSSQQEPEPEPEPEPEEEESEEEVRARL